MEPEDFFYTVDDINAVAEEYEARIADLHDKIGDLESYLGEALVGWGTAPDITPREIMRINQIKGKTGL